MNIRASLLLLVALSLVSCSEDLPTQATDPTVVEVTPGALAMAPGERTALEATLIDATGAPVAGPPVTWSTSSSSVATVDSAGVVLAVAVGTAEITATSGAYEGSATVRVASLAEATSTEVGPGGGTLSATLSNGGTLELVVPAGAVGAPTTFSIRPSLRAPGEDTRFGLAPAGVVFDQPVRIVYDPPQDTPEGASLYLTWEAAGAGPARFEEDALGRWIAVLGLLGGLAEPGAAPTAAPARAEGDEGYAEAAVQSGISGAEILAGGQEALDAFVAAPSLATADLLFRTVEVVATSAYEPDEILTRNAFLEQWRTVICQSGRTAVERYEGLPDADWDFQDFERESRLLSAWAIGAEQTTLRQELLLPFDGCVGGQPPFRAAIHTKATNLLPRIPGLVNPPNRDLAVRFDEVLDVHVDGLVDFMSTLGLFGAEDIQVEVGAIPGPMLDALRATAWSLCRDRRDQTKVARLLAETAGHLFSFFGYDAGDLAGDLSGCTVETEWRVRPMDEGGAWGTATGFGTLAAPSSGSPTPRVAVELAADEGLILAGLVQPLVCPGDPRQGIPPALNDESLLVIARPGIAQTVLASRTRPATLGLMYLQSDSLELTPAALAAAAGDPDWTEMELAVVRDGFSCGGVLGSLMPDQVRLATLDLTRPAPPAVEILSRTSTLWIREDNYLCGEGTRHDRTASGPGPYTLTLDGSMTCGNGLASLAGSWSAEQDSDTGPDASTITVGTTGSLSAEVTCTVTPEECSGSEARLFAGQSVRIVVRVTETMNFSFSGSHGESATGGTFYFRFLPRFWVRRIVGSQLDEKMSWGGSPTSYGRTGTMEPGDYQIGFENDGLVPALHGDGPVTHRWNTNVTLRMTRAAAAPATGGP